MLPVQLVFPLKEHVTGWDPLNQDFANCGLWTKSGQPLLCTALKFRMDFTFLNDNILNC